MEDRVTSFLSEGLFRQPILPRQFEPPLVILLFDCQASEGRVGVRLSYVSLLTILASSNHRGEVFKEPYTCGNTSYTSKRLARLLCVTTRHVLLSLPTFLTYMVVAEQIHPNTCKSSPLGRYSSPSFDR